MLKDVIFASYDLSRAGVKVGHQICVHRDNKDLEKGLIFCIKKISFSKGKKPPISKCIQIRYSPVAEPSDAC